MIILDTNVVSEMMKAEPSPKARKWLASCQASEIFLTAITAAEVLTGIALLPTGTRRNHMECAWKSMADPLSQDRIRPLDRIAAKQFALLVPAPRKLGRPIA